MMIDTEILQDIYTDHDLCDTQRKELVKVIAMIKQNRLIELPCALNSKLYFFGEKTDGTKVVDSITLSTYDHCINIGQHIGHGFYLTKEEAEAKLKELEG